MKLCKFLFCYFHRKCPRWVVSWSIVCLAVLSIIATSHAQTFQYSRGWTNGKRSGPVAPIGLVDLENGYLNPEMSELDLLPGHIQMSLSPQARLRTLDYNQVNDTFLQILILSISSSRCVIVYYKIAAPAYFCPCYRKIQSHDQKERFGV